MRRFYFRLERILRYKRDIEEKIEREFQLKRAEYLKVWNQIREMNNKLTDFIREVKNQNKEKPYFTAEEARAVDSYILRLEVTIEKLKGILDEKKAEMEMIKEELNRAKRERRAIEILKERSYSRYLEEVKREEFYELDDISQKLYLNREKLTLENVPLEEM